MSPKLVNLEEEMAPGVRGYTVEVGPDLYVPLIQAVHQGNGDVGRYLDSLPRDRRVVVPNVLSVRLLGMLERRGFTPKLEWAEQFGEYVEVWERVGEPAPDTEVRK